MAETIFSRGVERVSGFYPKAAVGRLMSDGSGSRVLAYRHPDPDVEAVRFSICEGEVLQAIGRGRGVRRSPNNPLDVLILTNAPLPLPVNMTCSWSDLRENAGPIEVLAARGIVPLDHAGLSEALPNWFKNDAAAAEWFQHRPEALTRLQELRSKARAGGAIEISEFLGNPLKISKGISQKLDVFSYRRTGKRQSNDVLVDTSVHRDPSAAVRAVLGGVDEVKPKRRG